jgi:hypothetical protein
MAALDNLPPGGEGKTEKETTRVQVVIKPLHERLVVTASIRCDEVGHENH